jgi:hypothetical protein
MASIDRSRLGVAARTPASVAIRRHSSAPSRSGPVHGYAPGYRSPGCSAEVCARRDATSSYRSWRGDSGAPAFWYWAIERSTRPVNSLIAAARSIRASTSVVTGRDLPFTVIEWMWIDPSRPHSSRRASTQLRFHRSARSRTRTCTARPCVAAPRTKTVLRDHYSDRISRRTPSGRTGAAYSLQHGFLRISVNHLLHRQIVALDILLKLDFR